MNNEFIKENLGENNKTQINIPFAKFYFYENGTLDKIFFPEGINDYYKTSIIDLIEKITPKLSKSLYKNENIKRRLENGDEGTYLNYEEFIKNGNLDKTKLYEDKIEKSSRNEKDEFTFENKQLNSSTVRTFNSSGDMTLLEMEGEARFISSLLEPKNDINNIKEERRIEEFNGEKNVETNESFYNLGFNEFKLNAKSNMELIKSGLEPKTLDNLKYLSQLIKFELYQTKNSSLYTEDGNEPEEEDITLNQKNNANNIKRNLANKKMNFVKS